MPIVRTFAMTFSATLLTSSGHLEVQHIARVVLDDAEDARVGRNCLDALIDLIRCRRGEYRPRDRRVEHALADVAAVRGLMAAAAA